MNQLSVTFFNIGWYNIRFRAININNKPCLGFLPKKYVQTNLLRRILNLNILHVFSTRGKIIGASRKMHAMGHAMLHAI